MFCAIILVVQLRGVLRDERDSQVRCSFRPVYAPCVGRPGVPPLERSGVMNWIPDLSPEAVAVIAVVIGLLGMLAASM